MTCYDYPYDCFLTDSMYICLCHIRVVYATIILGLR